MHGDMCYTDPKEFEPRKSYDRLDLQRLAEFLSTLDSIGLVVTGTIGNANGEPDNVLELGYDSAVRRHVIASL